MGSLTPRERNFLDVNPAVDSGVSVEELRETVGIYGDDSRDSELLECLGAAKEQLAEITGSPWPVALRVQYHFDAPATKQNLVLLNAAKGLADTSQLTVACSYIHRDNSTQAVDSSNYAIHVRGHDVWLVPIANWPSQTHETMQSPFTVEASIPSVAYGFSYGGSAIKQALRIIVAGLFLRTAPGEYMPHAMAALNPFTERMNRYG